MRKLPLLLAIGMLAPFAACAPARAAVDEGDPDVLRSLEINRSMLARFESEYDLLREVEPSKAPIVHTELRKLKYKMEALAQDSRRLEELLSEDKRAEAFLEETVKNAEKRAAETARQRRGPEPGTLTWRLHDKALELVAEKKMEEAALVYEEISMLDPDDDQAYLILGHVRLLMGQFVKAESAFENAIHIDASNRAQIVPFYENRVIQDPDDDDSYANLGFAHLLLGEIPEAGRAFENSLEINPDNERSLTGLELIERF